MKAPLPAALADPPYSAEEVLVAGDGWRHTAGKADFIRATLGRPLSMTPQRPARGSSSGRWTLHSPRGHVTTSQLVRRGHRA